MNKLLIFAGVLGLTSSVFVGISRADKAGKFNLSYENAPLSAVLNDISTFSSQNFVFKKSDLKGVFVSHDAQNVSLQESLDTLLLENNFEFKNIGAGILSVIPSSAKDIAALDITEALSETKVPEAFTERSPEVEEAPAEPSVIDRLIQSLDDPK